MKKILLLLGGALLIGQLSANAQTQASTTRPQGPRCGILQLKKAMIAKDPTWADKFAAQRDALQANANYYIAQQKLAATQRTTTTISAVPIIFHIIVDSAQFLLLGGTEGIINRCDSQIAVLNRDYNHQNADSTSIPSSWKDSLYGNAGIHFGLAHKDPTGACSPGYEVKIIAGTTTTDAGFSNINEAFPEAKTNTTGLAAWDVTKYYNVWCINFTGGASSLLGLTQPLSFLSGSTLDQEGVCMLYNTLGCTAADGTPPPNTGGSAGWVYPYNLGRTLSHETGHFFEIWHPWGDDGGQCPWSSTATITGSGLIAGEDNGISCTGGVGSDDGLSDTPPESDAVYGNPTYTIPGGTTNDCCEMHGTVNTQPIGIACLSFMDYTDDDAMHLLTPMQAAAVASMVLVPPTSTTGATGSGTVGENYNLTQNPSLLVCPTTGISNTTTVNTDLNIFPNPTTGQVTITLNASADVLHGIQVINLLGQEVMTIQGQNQDYYSLDLSGMAKGIYFVKCNFASGSVTHKILLQ